MIPKQTITLALGVLVAGMLLSSKCNKDAIIMPPDPCAAAKPVKADFVMLEEIGDTSFQIKDSAVLNRFVTFKAVGEYDSVKWEIGSALNVSNRLSFSLYFNVLESNIPIKFTGYNKKNRNCFPSNLTVQTVTKQLTIVKQAHSALLGRYLGCNTDSPVDTFTVTVQLDDSNLGYLKNIPNGCEGQTSNDYGYNYLKFGLFIGYGFSGMLQTRVFSPSCGEIYSKGYLIGRDTLIVNYSYRKVIAPFTLEEKPTFKTFRGVRQR